MIGAGSFGTAVARHIATMSGERCFDEISLYCRSEDRARAINMTSRNPSRLSEHELPRSITAISGDRELEAALCESPFVVLAVPAQSMRGSLEQIARVAPGEQLKLLSLAKGIELGTGSFMRDVASEVLPDAEWSALCGPSHAEEVIVGMPTAVVVASRDEDAAFAWQRALNDDRFRVYTSRDVAGVELGGAMKNVTAIAVGIARAAGFGDNSVAALVTRGLAEIMRCGATLGADPITLAGLAGIGDLMVTCYSGLSRNFRFGGLIGRGMSAEEASREVGEAVEGMYTVKALVARARRAGLDLPISEGVQRILYEGASVREVMTSLMTREPKKEAHEPHA